MILNAIVPNWWYCTNDQTHDPSDLAYVGNDLLSEFINRTPIPLNENLIIDLGTDGPVYYDGQHLIHLKTPTNLMYDKTTFQLAHELMHFTIGSENDTWFEESLCALSSIYFLHAMTNNWSAQSDANKIGYAVNFNQYASNNFKPQIINLSDLTKPNSELYRYMESNIEDRPKNNYIASKMLPIAEKYRDFWKITEPIKFVPYNLPINFRLIQMQKLAPELTPIFDELIQIFQ